MARKPIADRKQRARTVRFRETNTGSNLHALQGSESGDMEAEQIEERQENGDGGEQEQMEKLDAKYQQLRDKMEEYFEDEHGKQQRVPPMVKVPKSQIREEYERHQVTHTPFAIWCKHCVAASVIKTKHLTKGGWN